MVAFCVSAFGQSKDLKELQQKFWNTTNKQSKVTEIPEKWNNESAVVLYRDEFYQYTNNGKKMYNPSHFHQRVLLLDKAAIENFSEISIDKDDRIGGLFMNWKKDVTTVGIKIVKPNGEERIIDVDNEKVSQDAEFKVAIPNLEIGDIVDIFIFEDDYLRSFSGTHVYDPVERVLSTQYPVLFSRLAVEVENDYFLNMESFNGAPRIKEEQTDKRATRRYVLEASDLEKSDFPRWFYPFAEFPCLKFQVVFALKAKNEDYAGVFLGDKDAERKTGVTKDEIVEYYGDRFDASNKSSVKDVLKYLETLGPISKREQLEKALYYVRHKSFNRFFELFIARENNIAPFALPCDTDYVILNENSFVNYFAGLAKQLEVDYDIVIATADYNGSIDDLLLRSNVSYGLRFNFDTPMYLFDVSPHVQADFFPYSLEGTKVYTLAVQKNRNIEGVTFDHLPMTTSDKNLSKESVEISFGDDFKKINVNRELNYTGHYKVENLSRRLVLQDFLEEEFQHYNTKHFYHCKEKQGKKEAVIEQKINSAMETYEKNKKDRIETIVSENYDVPIKEYGYEVKETGRYSNDPLIIRDHFTIENEFVKKAGKNYIVEVGKFIGGQVQLREEELDRKENVYLNFAKTLQYEIAFQIPEGYTVEGLEKLKKNVQNQTGSFVSDASIKDGKVIFSATKVYAKKTYTSQQWSDMIPWLQEAYDFSQEKVMFKKI